MNSLDTFRLECGVRLKAVRKENGLSQQQMGERLRMSWRSYQNFEIGARTMPVDCAIRFCEEFSVELLWLTKGIGPKECKGGLAETVIKAAGLIEAAMDRSGTHLNRATFSNLIARVAERLHEQGEIDNYLDIATSSTIEIINT